MTFYRDVFESGLSPRGLTSAEYQGTFTSGKTLFFIGGTWCANLEYADGFEWNYTYCPAFEGYENSVATPTGSWHLGVSAYSEKAEAAADFVKSAFIYGDQTRAAALMTVLLLLVGIIVAIQFVALNKES